MQITRDLVAKRAGVSSATVSRVFNNPDAVSPQLRKAVLQASDDLGYTPNKAAGLLRRRGTGVIAFVEFAKEGRPYYWGDLESFDWFFGRALRGIQEAIQDTSWQVRFYKVRDKTELHHIQAQCDGILAYDVDSEEEVQLFENIGIPYVLAHHIRGRENTSVVRTDNYEGGLLQGRYLKKMGCTSPLYLTGYLKSVPPHAKRLEGFLSIYPHSTIIETTVGSSDAITRILKSVQHLEREGLIDSMAAVNDLTLFDLLIKGGSSLPSVGYDASPFYKLFSGPIASIDIQSDMIYKHATEELLLLIGGSEPQEKIIRPKLVELC